MPAYLRPRWPRAIDPASLLQAALWLACAWGCWQAHQTLLALPAPVTTEASASWSPRAVRAMALTYRAVAADGFYLRAVNAFGSRAEHRKHYPTLAPLLWRSSHLDAHFAAPYLLAGTALTFPGADQEAAMSLLTRGTQQRPDVWRIPFLYGFELFSRQQTRAAAQAMATASRAPEAPPFVASLAVRLAAESGDPELGLAMLEALEHSVAHHLQPGWDTERRAALSYQRELSAWQQRAQAFADVHGRAPRTLRELAQSGPGGDGLPMTDPWGAPYTMDEDGRVASANTKRLLRVHRTPQGAEL